MLKRRFKLECGSWLNYGCVGDEEESKRVSVERRRMDLGTKVAFLRWILQAGQRRWRSEGGHWNAEWRACEGSLITSTATVTVCWSYMWVRVLTDKPVTLEQKQFSANDFCCRWWDGTSWWYSQQSCSKRSLNGFLTLKEQSFLRRWRRCWHLRRISSALEENLSRDSTGFPPCLQFVLHSEVVEMWGHV